MRSAREDVTFVDAFDELFLRAEALAQRLLRDRSASEDVAAEALARAWVRWPRLSTPAHRAGFVIKVAGNLAIDHIRRSKVAAARVDMADLADDVALRLALVGALRALPLRQREAVVLRFLGGMSESEVAVSLGISVGSVKTHVHRGVASLRRRLGDGQGRLDLSAGEVGNAG